MASGRTWGVELKVTHILDRHHVIAAICTLLLTPIGIRPGLMCEPLHASETARYWPQWRGPLATGVAPQAHPPLEWQEAVDGNDQNIRWKTKLPGKGHSTPVVWEDRVFLTTAVPLGEPLEPKYSQAPGAHDNVPVTHQHRFAVLGVSRVNGRILWQKTVREKVPHEGGHYTASHASASPVTDGEYLFAFFGSNGLYCLNLDGEVVWRQDFGEMQTRHGHGEGGSPVLYGETVIVNWDHEGRSFVAALDKHTGQERWRTPRDEVTSWATPIVVEQDGTVQVVISGTQRVRAYDLETGKVIWSCGGLSRNIVASPVADRGMLFVASSYDTRNLLAIRLDGARGDITESDHVAWSTRRLTPYVPSLLLYSHTLYFLRHYQGILTRLDAQSGQPITGPLRLNGIRDVYASPVAADNRIYITDLDGTTVVVAHDPLPRILAVNRLRESVSASAAIVDSELYLRGSHSLYCLMDDGAGP